VSVRSSSLFQDWLTSSGTSLAAPHVSGALALLTSAYAGPLSADREATALRAGAVDLGAAGPDDQFGAGRLDVQRSLDWLRTAPDFGISADAATARTTAGGSVTYRLGVSPINGFTGDVSLLATGLDPTQATTTWSPPIVAGGVGASQLTVKTAAGLAPGVYLLRVIASSGGITRSAALSLEVSGPPDFYLDATPPANSVVLGATASYTLKVVAVNGFARGVTLSVTGLPAGARATFSPNPVSSGGSSVMRIVTTGGTRRGTFALTVKAASGVLSHTSRVTLTTR
jgi:hypothetical protein